LWPVIEWHPDLVVAAAGLTLTAAFAYRLLHGVQGARTRGALVESAAPNQRRTTRRRRRDATLLSVAGIAIAPEDECKHFKLIGTTGTGKSTAIRELIGAALARGDRAVIADPDGGYCRTFHDRYRGDVLLNPFDPESVTWDPFAELQNDFDVEQLVQALIPDCADPATREWRGYARTLVSALVRRCRPNVSELWRLLTVAGTEELRRVTQGTAAQPFLEPENGRMFGSIRSVAGSALGALEFVQRQRTRPFSVRRWVQSPASPVLFIPYQANQIAALRSVISAWMRLAVFETLSGRENYDQRLWFVIDELDALGPIGGLKDALARLRKFGGRCVLGFQSIAQVSSSYGADAQTVVENCGTSLILRCSGSENGGTSQFASRLIGDRERIRPQISRGVDREMPGFARGGRRSRNVTDQWITEPGVMPAELEQLPDFSGYFKAASSPAWLKLKWGPYAKRR
jgi:type IV secretory pathway TraG/TraD family ATPase VirD4